MLQEYQLTEAVGQLRQAAEAKKCWGCGCLHGSLDSIDDAFPVGARPAELNTVLNEARARLIPPKYDCLGCDVCFPPLAMNALQIEAEACPAESVQARDGWPPLPGSYTVLRYGAPVAICTLTDQRLCSVIAVAAGSDVALVGNVYTENLGLERIIRNILANPSIRFLLLCGPDSRQAIGHLPGQSMLALARSGVDERGRIIGAHGKRPVLKNVSGQAVEHFRKTIEVIDLVGCSDLNQILEVTRTCAARTPPAAESFSVEGLIEPIRGYLPEKMISDPAGYFVVYPDRSRGVISLEHYANDGLLRHVIEGNSAAEIYIPAVEKKLVPRLDHAAYLGRELARAERALHDGSAYVQDAAPELGLTNQSPTPENSSCHCGSPCGGKELSPWR